MSIMSDIYPRMKAIHPIYRVTAQRFRIGVQRNLTIEIDDIDGQVWTLVHLLDGTRNFAEITYAMQQAYPALTESDISISIQQLDLEGFIEDASACRYDAPQPDDMAQRYIGNVNYFSHFARLDEQRGSIQDKLCLTKVVLFGLGNVGSGVLSALVSSGIGTIVGVDYGRVEMANINGQFLYREQDIGQFRTAAAERAVRAMNSTVNFSTVTENIAAAEELRSIIRGADLVICAMDESPFLSLRQVNQACVAGVIPCLYSVSQVSRARIFSVVPYQSGCFDCLHVYLTKRDPFVVAQLKGLLESHFAPPRISFGPQIMRLCGTIVDEAVRLVTNYIQPLSIGTQLELDYCSGSLELLWKWNHYVEECPTCGGGKEEWFPGLSTYTGSGLLN